MSLPRDRNLGDNYILGLSWENPEGNAGNPENYLGSGLCHTNLGLALTNATIETQASCGLIKSPGQQSANITVEVPEDVGDQCVLSDMLIHAAINRLDLFFNFWNGIGGGRRYWGAAFIADMGQTGPAQDHASHTFTMEVNGPLSTWIRRFQSDNCNLHPDSIL